MWTPALGRFGEKMKKYKSYSPVLFIILILGLPLALWMVFGTILGIISEDKTDTFVVIIGILLIIGDSCLLSECFRKIKISDDYISRRNFFLKERKMFFSEIIKYEVSIGQYENDIILYSTDNKIKIPFFDKKFVLDFSEILRKKFCLETKQKVENMKKNGIQLHCSKYKINCDIDGITNLKNGKKFTWENIKCKKIENIYGNSYTFIIDKEIKFGMNKINFNFAMEDFFEEMSKKCIIT